MTELPKRMRTCCTRLSGYLLSLITNASNTVFRNRIRSSAFSTVKYGVTVPCSSGLLSGLTNSPFPSAKLLFKKPFSIHNPVFARHGSFTIQRQVSRHSKRSFSAARYQPDTERNYVNSYSKRHNRQGHLEPSFSTTVACWLKRFESE